MLLAGIALPGLICLAIALLLVIARRRLEPDEDGVVDEINRLLPQTQCAQCGYPGCRPYAEAVVAGEAINLCPPGGESTVAALSKLLGQPSLPLAKTALPVIAVIREAECIGCTLCIRACPVDAIVGAPQLMHTVITSECTGCELCIAPCPVDCIDLVSIPEPTKLPVETGGATACITCGECEPACPKNLAPQQLLLFRNNLPRARNLLLDDCVECRLCDRVCPAEIPLTDIFRDMKQRQRQAALEETKARYTQGRVDARSERLISTTARVKTRPGRSEAARLLEDLS